MAHDFDNSGLGISGAGRHDLGAETAELIARGEMHVREHKRTGPMSHGQLWQPCDKWECNEEPVCLDCEYCEHHCEC